MYSVKMEAGKALWQKSLLNKMGMNIKLIYTMDQMESSKIKRERIKQG
jgi:hypothetical protein